MFNHESKLSKLATKERLNIYRKVYFALRNLQEEGTLSMHPQNNYLGGNELATDIYNRKYFLKDLKGTVIEKRPEYLFARLASYMATMEEGDEKQMYWAKEFYNCLYEGYFVPGGRVIAGAGDLYRLKTLANCFVTLIEEDNMESIYKAAYECARTYSYGGGIGTDISSLRPKNSVVHNAADVSTGAVSFMDLYSLTTGLIGQSGRRGALMLTLDVKHPDILDFVNVKRNPNWVTKQIVDQCRWSGAFDEEHLREVERQVRENTQIRFANISIKVSDEFMQAVEEETMYGKDAYVVYHKAKGEIIELKQSKENHYSYGMPSKEISRYQKVKVLKSFQELHEFIQENYGLELTKDQLKNSEYRDVFGDVVMILKDADYDVAVRAAGDFMLYYASQDVGEVKRLIKARDIWNQFVASNYKTAEPGLIFWSTMTKYSPSNYVGRPIASTNPCGEVPLESGGACNLGSVNLSRLVIDGFTENARLDWDKLKSVTKILTRFLDNVVSWNQVLNPLDKQKKAAAETRRLGLGIMGIADMFLQMGIGYDSDEGIELMEEIAKVMANVTYVASAELAEEKGSSPIYNTEDYEKGAFFQERLTQETKAIVKQKGLRNIAILSIAPTGTISNIVLSYKEGTKNYIGVSGGIEPIFSLYYTRRSEQMNEGAFYNVFHSTAQAFIDKKQLNDKVQKIKSAEELRYVLPEYFFRTAHFISPENRVKIQGIVQKYIDHSISSTVNLPESISPEVISSVYVQAWKNDLKGITIYRDGSRYPILSIDQKQTEFQDFKKKMFKVTINGKEEIYTGEEVFVLPNGKLTTPFHALDLNVEGVTIQEIVKKPSPQIISEEKGSSEGGVCKIEFVDGKVVKSCAE